MGRFEGREEGKEGTRKERKGEMRDVGRGCPIVGYRK